MNVSTAKAALRVLIVEDSENDAQLLIRELRRGGYEPICERVDTLQAMLAALDNRPWDIVLADYVMPRFSGPAALEVVKSRGLDLPFIIVSGNVGEDVAVQAMRAGAHDYILKGSLVRLVPAIERELRDADVRRERRQLEEQLKRAQRLEMAGQLASQVAHDFGNLLTPIVGNSQLIKRRLSDGHPAIRFCDAILQSARQMAALNQDLLTLGRRGRLDEEPVDVNQLVRQAIAQISDKPSTLRIQLDLAPDLAPIEGAPAQLLRVVANLVSNAREAMQDDGTLTVRTEKTSKDRPFGHYNRAEPGDYITISIADTGCGIADDVMDHVFDPFFTTKSMGRRSGSGLGLSIVQAIVGDHRGYVDLETEVGSGTCFYIHFPIGQPREGQDCQKPAGEVCRPNERETRVSI